jgi:hypothetical protein
MTEMSCVFAVVVQVMACRAVVLVCGVNVRVGAGASITPVPGVGNFTDPVAPSAGNPVSCPDTWAWPLSGTLAAAACCAVTVAARSMDVTPFKWLSTDGGRVALVVLSVMLNGLPAATVPGNFSVALSVTGGIPLPYFDRSQEYVLVTVFGWAAMRAKPIGPAL